MYQNPQLLKQATKLINKMINFWPIFGQLLVDLMIQFSRKDWTIKWPHLVGKILNSKVHDFVNDQFYYDTIFTSKISIKEQNKF